LIFAVGVIDDLYDLKPWYKLSGQFVASAWLYVAGLRIDAIAGEALADSHWVAFPLTVLWLLACTNAFNLIDGIDGLASGVGFFATVTILLSALLQGNLELQILTAPLAAALLAFLRYNFNPASIFLGDSGAMLIGFLLGGYGIIWSQKSATLIGMTAPLFVMAFPIAEMLISIVRRYLRGNPIFGADRGHIHHQLLELGFAPRQAAIVIYAVAALCAGFSLVMAQPAIRDRGVVLILFCVLSWIGFQNLGYTEFISARRILLGGAVRKLLASDIRVHSFITELDRAKSLSDCWGATVTALRDLGFDSVELRVTPNQPKPAIFRREDLREAASMSIDETQVWSLKVPLDIDGAGHLLISRRMDQQAGHYFVESIIDAVRRDFPGHIRAALDQQPDVAQTTQERPRVASAAAGR
jgi:UDP-GlcNAc:undecaprenyl-phosphate GlcNAc-1-phosphate transferase